MEGAGVEEGRGTGGGEDVKSGGEVVFGATVDAAVVDVGNDEVDDGTKVELEAGTGAAEEVGFEGVPAVALKMSTTLDAPPAPAHIMSDESVPDTSHSSNVCIPPALHPLHTTTTLAVTAVSITRRTLATSEDGESLIRQRCGCKLISSLAENCSAPVSRRRIEDVHNFGISATSEDRESSIRQRCGCQKISSLAEIRSAPVSRRRIEDIHNFGCSSQKICAHYE
jgi:hypothetical protein